MVRDYIGGIVRWIKVALKPICRQLPRDILAHVCVRIGVIDAEADATINRYDGAKARNIVAQFLIGEGDTPHI